MDATTVSSAEKESGIRWLFFNMRKAIGAFCGRHKVSAAVTVLTIIAAALLFREVWQPYAVMVRRYAAPIAVSLGIIICAWIWSRRARWWKRMLAMLAALTLVLGAVMVYEYVALWVRYQSFNVTALERLPETDHERIQPLSSVHALARGITGDSRNPTPPDFVWMRDKHTGQIAFRWTMGVEPRLWMDKIFGSVNEVVSVSGTDPAPRFTPESRNVVRFTVGESLWLSSNAHTAAVRALSPLQFFNYEPADVRYMQDDNGSMVEVISLLRWEGILFPYPEFGGVLIVHQQPESSLGEQALSFAERVALGAGNWIPPERIREFPYLRGQNILPYRVSHYIAESLRFMNGFLAPLPWYHQGDVRIPDSKENMNPQPYATFFKETEATPGMLYHYFSLEPYLAGKHGLVASVLIPADGTSHVFVYQHVKKNESLMGVSMVPALVRDSKKNYNWDKSAPVEERPFVRYVNGERRLLWLTTVVTYKDSKKEEFVTGSVPEVALVDAGTQEVIWVDPRDQAGWTKLLSK